MVKSCRSSHIVFKPPVARSILVTASFSHVLTYNDLKRREWLWLELVQANRLRPKRRGGKIFATDGFDTTMYQRAQTDQPQALVDSSDPDHFLYSRPDRPWIDEKQATPARA